jgi:hypothetical protein
MDMVTSCKSMQFKLCYFDCLLQVYIKETKLDAQNNSFLQKKIHLVTYL